MNGMMELIIKPANMHEWFEQKRMEFEALSETK